MRTKRFKIKDGRVIREAAETRHEKKGEKAGDELRMTNISRIDTALWLRFEQAGPEFRRQGRRAGRICPERRSICGNKLERRWKMKSVEELTEARAIILALAAIRDRLSLSDVRFLESWQSYLAKAGDQAQIGRWRLHNLRRVAESYGVSVPERARIDVSDMPAWVTD